MRANDTQTVSYSDIMILIEQFSQLLKEEKILLQEKNIQKVVDLQPQKNEMIDLIQGLNKHIEQEPSIISDLNPTQKRQLEVVIKLFTNLVADNHRQLVALQELNQHVINTIHDTLNEDNREATYNSDGKTNSGFQTYNILSEEA